MKHLALLALCILPISAFTKDKVSKPIVKAKKTYLNKKLAGIEVYDKRGNLIFSKNDGMNGPLSMICYSEYDSLNREVRTASVHSNFGYSYQENVYRDQQIFHYISVDDNPAADTFTRECLARIRSPEDFQALSAISRLKARKKQLTLIKELDEASNVLTEIYLSEKGDSTSINRFRYNDRNKNIYFHMGSLKDETWQYDIHYLYDDRSNQIRSFRVSGNALKDTTEVYNYKYNERNQLLSDNYYYKGQFRNRTDYYYNAQHQLVKELFYQDTESTIDAVTTNRYDSEGRLSRKEIINNLNPKQDRREVYKYFYTLW